MIISAPRLFVDGAFTGPGAVEVRGGVIAGVVAGRVAADIVLDGGFLAPGLIDLHNNGAFGVDFAAAPVAQIGDCVAALGDRGVTAVMPTIITAPWDYLGESAGRLGAAMAGHPGILGVHLEGPFLAAAKRGAHRADWLRAPDRENLDLLLGDDRLLRAVRMVTLAPELAGAVAAVGRLVAAGIVVSLGHTVADSRAVLAAVGAGASLVTHIFTAMGAVVHRGVGAPGVPVLGLTDERLAPCLIVDGVHVDGALLKLAFLGCERAIAVTDSILVAGLGVGAAAAFGGGEVVLGADGVGRRPDGVVAGAGIILDEGVRRLVAAGVPAEAALAAATVRPADAVGRRDLGRIKVGARADLVWFGDDFAVNRVFRAGVGAAAVAKRRSGTEAVREDLLDLDLRPTAEIVGVFLAQERAAQAALGRAAPALAGLVDAVAGRLKAGGRLFYVGAGTSGRLALLDAVECGPTFGVAEGLIVPVLAGGDKAFLRAAEGAEDDGAAAVEALRGHGLSAADAVVGIAASGSTPFTVAAVRYAGEVGAVTGAIVGNFGSEIAACVAFAVEIGVGAEVIAGSTRLSAGTSQKVALNVLSSVAMIGLGKVFGPYMVDVRATNAKLRRRAVGIVKVLAGVDEVVAAAALEACGMKVKVAVAMLKLGVDAAGAEEILRAKNGFLREALG